MSSECSHEVQLAGLCALCGIDVSRLSDSAEANISLSHHHNALTVTRKEAERLHEENTQALLSAKKLSLIVDLDQTVVHATVDPTVGEWLEDPSNPNYEALQHVGRFKLALDGSQVPSTSVSSGNNKGKQKAADQSDGKAEEEEEDDGGCWYYVKSRPGLRAFLEAASQKYEMHVYTMGTRSYAESVCTIIDPETKFFGSRILTRDESGSMTQKSLERLFPCETSMVVVIDDRGDVWDWSPNLLKVVPYEFFVGIGDINAAFLPKQSSITLPTSETTPPPARNGEAPISDTVPSTTEASQATSEALSNQIADRPLSRRQAEVSAEHATDHKDGMDCEAEDEEQVAVLKDEDSELDRLLHLLTEVHKQFYAKIERGRSADVKSIISTIKLAVLKNVNILFSSVIPLGVDQAKSEIWRLAESFGAICWMQLNKNVTHLVAGKEGTAKVNAAKERKDITVVWTAWLIDSMAIWKRIDEKKYSISGAEVPILDDPDHLAADPGEAADDSELDEAVDIEDADIDWGTADAELEAYLEQSDDDSSVPGSALSTPKLKRSRSATPGSEHEDSDNPASPLLKRQRIANQRKSKLKVSFGTTSSLPASESELGPGEDSDSDQDLEAMLNEGMG